MAHTKNKKELVSGEFVDLHKLRGLGEDPVYHQPEFKDWPRFWPLNKWEEAPTEMGYVDFVNVAWRGLRLLKDPDTQAAYHNLLWELKPKTIVELGVYSGGSLVWFRDLTKMFHSPAKIIGIDNDLSRNQIPKELMDEITLIEGDCNEPHEIMEKLCALEHPILLIDDAHCNTFNILKQAVNTILKVGDYVVIEDTMAMWKRYTPNLLKNQLSAFNDVFQMDLLYSNAAGQLHAGVFKVTKSNN